MIDDIDHKITVESLRAIDEYIIKHTDCRSSLHTRLSYPFVSVNSKGVKASCMDRSAMVFIYDNIIEVSLSAGPVLRATHRLPLADPESLPNIVKILEGYLHTV